MHLQMDNPLVRIIDDDHEVCTALEYMLLAEGIMSISYESAESFLTHDLRNQPGCVVLDVRMPRLNGIELHERLIEENYPHPIIFLSGHGDIDMAVAAVKRGALDFLQKPIDSQRFLCIVRDALRRDIDPRRPSKEQLRKNFETLTTRERQVIELLLEDLSNSLIAERLQLSIRTIEAHRAGAYVRLGVNSLEQLKDYYSKT